MKYTCRDCGKIMDQDRGEGVNVINPWIPDQGFDLCDDCREKHGNNIVCCEHCTDLTERKFLSAKLVPMGFTACPGCGRDVFTGKSAIEYKTMTCKKCGRLILDPDNEARVLNEGTGNERYACNACFDSMWDAGEITKCENCGTWFEVACLHRDPDVEDFTPCPECGKDVCEGYTREEAAALMSERKEGKMGNTAVNYVYIDKSGRVQNNREVLRGAFSGDQAMSFRLWKNEYPSFIPSQIGLPEIRFLNRGKFDDAWFRLMSFQPTFEEPTVTITTDEFCKRYVDGFMGGWDNSLWLNRPAQHKCHKCGRLLTEGANFVHKGLFGSQHVAWCDDCDKKLFAN